jgi:hypothetical protein
MRFVSGYVLPIVEISKAISIIFTSYSPYLVKDAPISRKIFVADLTELSIFVPKIKKAFFPLIIFGKTDIIEINPLYCITKVAKHNCA